MNSSIDSNGRERLQGSEYHRTREEALWQLIEAEHAEAWSRAGWIGKVKVRVRMYRQFRREAEKLRSSPAALRAETGGE